MKIIVITPTYNEKENIGKFLDALDTEFKQITSHQMCVLVVDGNSPDGTADIVRQKQQTRTNVYLLVEKEKSGLGSAYILGMTHAMDNLDADAVMEMDADFQHDPKDIKLFVKEFELGADYIIGSRYIKGGSIPKAWALHRKFLSYFSNFLLRATLGVWAVHDFTSGFRLARTSALKQINLNNLEKKAYTYKIQLLYEMYKKGLKIKEIPNQFGLRDRGDSKMEMQNIVESFRLMLKLRFGNDLSFFKFLIVGLMGLTAQTIVYFGSVLLLKVNPVDAIIPAFLVAACTTFTFNNLWSFKERKIEGVVPKLMKFAIFMIVNIGSFFIQRYSIKFSQIISHNSVYWALFFGYPLGIALGIIWNYSFYNKLVWRKKTERLS